MSLCELDKAGPVWKQVNVPLQVWKPRTSEGPSHTLIQTRLWILLWISNTSSEWHNANTQHNRKQSKQKTPTCSIWTKRSNSQENISVLQRCVLYNSPTVCSSGVWRAINNTLTVHTIVQTIFNFSELLKNCWRMVKCVCGWVAESIMTVKQDAIHSPRGFQVFVQCVVLYQQVN